MIADLRPAVFAKLGLGGTALCCHPYDICTALIAQEAGCTPAQLALAWLLHQGPDIIPIPGTTSEAHLRENMGALGVKLDAALLARLDAQINQRTVAGNRYGAQARVEVDTEEFGEG